MHYKFFCQILLLLYDNLFLSFFLTIQKFCCFRWWINSNATALKLSNNQLLRIMFADKRHITYVSPGNTLYLHSPSNTSKNGWIHMFYCEFLKSKNFVMAWLLVTVIQEHSCPICNISLTSLSPIQRNSHVNMCLNGQRLKLFLHKTPQRQTTIISFFSNVCLRAIVRIVLPFHQ